MKYYAGNTHKYLYRLLKGNPFSYDGGEIRDKMGINPNVYMHAIYIIAEGSDLANEITYTDRSVSNSECI